MRESAKIARRYGVRLHTILRAWTRSVQLIMGPRPVAYWSRTIGGERRGVCACGDVNDDEGSFAQREQELPLPVLNMSRVGIDRSRNIGTRRQDRGRGRRSASSDARPRSSWRSAATARLKIGLLPPEGRRPLCPLGSARDRNG